MSTNSWYNLGPILTLECTVAGHKATLLVDSGASRQFISQRFVDKHKLEVTQLPTPTYTTVADGRTVAITSKLSSTAFSFDKFEDECDWSLLPYEGHDGILGMPWFRAYEPIINWKKRQVTYPDGIQSNALLNQQHDEEEKSEMIQAAASELDSIESKWKPSGDLARQEEKVIKDAQNLFANERTTIVELKKQIEIWDQESKRSEKQFNDETALRVQHLATLQQDIVKKKKEIYETKASCGDIEMDDLQQLVSLFELGLMSSELETEWKRELPKAHPSITLIKQFQSSLPNILQSISIKPKEALESFLLESGKSLINPKLLYKASVNGWTKDDFVQQCLGKSHTLMLVKVAGNGYVFGAYIAPEITMKKGGVPDPSKKSFLFSLINEYDQPLRSSLIDPTSAIDLSWGAVSFGRCDVDEKTRTHYFNFYLFNGQPANTPSGNASSGTEDLFAYAYQLDEESKKCGFKIVHDTLAGSQHFGAIEIEVFQL